MARGTMYGCWRMLMPAFLLLAVLAGWVQAAPAPLPDASTVQNPGVELWNDVRQRVGSEPGDVRTQVQGVDNTVLINTEGEDWRNYRMQELIPNAAKLLGLVLLAIVVFRLVRGKVKIKSGRSGQKIKRFSTFQRLVHWVTAILFVVLSITGIFLLFGRYLVIPYLGEAGGSVMFLLKRVHDFSGPAFAVALLVLAVTFLKGNFPHWRDIVWIAKGGGLLGWHAPAGRYNAGEKGWYWAVVVIGAAVVVSGLVLDFPNFGQARNTMMYYHWLHSIAAVVIMAASLGHIYMGTIAMEGAYEAMATGYCDANWAKEHHDVWYDEMAKAGKVATGADGDDGLPEPVQAAAQES